MSSSTPNLGLTLYDSSGDQAVTFATFRAVWGGTAPTSNFYKIDTAWGALDTRIDVLEAYRGSIPVAAAFISSNYYEAGSVSAITSYTTGMTIILSVDATSSGTVTLNINALGIKSVMKNNSSGTAINLTGADLVVGRKYLFEYDGTRWLWVSSNSADQINIVGTAGNLVTVNTDNSLLGTLTQSLMISQTVHAATGKTTPVDADELVIADSAASFVSKKLTWANIKATLKTYFDTLYPAITAATPNDGWIASSATWTYSSADSPSFVISINADVTSLIAVGYRIKLTQTTVKYFIVTAVGAFSAGATLITVYGGTDHTLANAAITSPYYSPIKVPFGFNSLATKWTVAVTNTSNNAQASPVTNTWYNLGSISIDIPIGGWLIAYKVCLRADKTAATLVNVFSTLSTANNSETDPTFTNQLQIGGASGSMIVQGSVYNEKILTVASKTPYYLNTRVTTAADNVNNRNDVVSLFITAQCIYL